MDVKANFLRLYFLPSFLFIFCEATIFTNGLPGQTLSGNTGQTQEKPEKPKVQTIVRSFYKFPPAVEKTRKESLVAVEFTAARITEDAVSKIKLLSSGFVVDDNGSIATTLHSLGDVPAEWMSDMTSIRVHDSNDFFSAELEKYDWMTDLAMIRIKDWQNNKGRFRKIPIKLADTSDKIKLETIEHFYTFCFTVLDEGFYDLPIIFGPYFLETNVVDDKIKHVLFGIVGGAADNGCSGGPLIGPDGRTYGVISRATPTHTCVVTSEELENFIIQSDQETINKKGISEQNKK